jgi:hypothetical protein
MSYSWAERLIAANLGLPYSIVLDENNTGSWNDYRTSNTPTPLVENMYISRFNQIKNVVFNMGNALETNTEISIPLGMLNGFFQEEAWLPAGLPFRIEIEYDPTVFAIAKGSSISATQSYCMYLQQQWTSNMSLKYRSHILKADIQDAINNEWLSKPFLYQYETFEYVEIIGDGSTVTLTKDIAINQQRPTQLYFRILPNASKGFGTTSVESLSYYNYWDSFGGRSCWFANADAGPFRIKNIFIFIGGRQNYYLRMDENGNSSGPYCSGGAAAAVNELVNGRCYQSPDHHPLTSYSEPCHLNFAKPFCVSINPGDFVKKGYISSDSGALSIRVNCDVVWNPTNNATANPKICNIPLPKEFKLVIYKKYPEQLQINAAKNLNVVTWPAVVASNNYLIPSTYNMN